MHLCAHDSLYKACANPVTHPEGELCGTSTSHGWEGPLRGGPCQQHLVKCNNSINNNDSSSSRQNQAWDQRGEARCPASRSWCGAEAGCNPDPSDLRSSTRALRLAHGGASPRCTAQTNPLPALLSRITPPLPALP